jgi:hypothetical protein
LFSGQSIMGEQAGQQPKGSAPAPAAKDEAAPAEPARA